MNTAPEFAQGQWLNSPNKVQMKQLHGSVVLVDIWDYTSIHCLRALPYVKRWYERYAEHGLVVVGIHAPEFAFGRERAQVEAALQELDIRYPVLLDNEFKTWHRFKNQFWPARYLIDTQGRVRGHTYGEGDYAQTEAQLQGLLREINPNAELPPVIAPLDAENPARVPRPTPQLRGGLHGGALGNPEGYAGNAPLLYSLPRQRTPGAFYVAGAWRASHEYLMYQGTHEGIIHVPYEATEVNAVLSPHADVVERSIHPMAVAIEIWQDDRPIQDEQRGADLTEDGRLQVTRPRMYNLIRNPGHEQHELTLRVRNQGFALYSFSFVSSANAWHSA